MPTTIFYLYKKAAGGERQPLTERPQYTVLAKVSEAHIPRDRIVLSPNEDHLRNLTESEIMEWFNTAEWLSSDRRIELDRLVAVFIVPTGIPRLRNTRESSKRACLLEDLISNTA
jgi:hypothetical protein